jgi:hypothetical protein
MHENERLRRLVECANGRRRVRTVSYAAAARCVTEALRDGYGCDHGGYVCRSYDYPATAVAVIAGRRKSGAVAVCVGPAGAREGSAPRPLALKHDIPTISRGTEGERESVLRWADGVELDDAGVIILSAAEAKRLRVATIYCWVRTPDDDRDTAGGTAMAVVPQAVAAKIAQAIDLSGDDGAGVYLGRFDLGAGYHLAAGHGVTVYYASGTSRSFHAWRDRTPKLNRR